VVAHNSKPPSNTPPSSVGTVSGRPGPAVLVKPLPPNSRREEYQRYEVQHSTAPVKRPVEKEAAVMKSHERELAERSTKELHSLIRKLVDEREYDESEYFQTVDTNDGEIAVLKDNALVQLSDAVSKLVNLAYFSAVALDKVLAIQSLCQPVITATSQLALALDGPDPDDLVVRLGRAEFGLRASKLMLQTMTEGSNDRRLCSEDLVKGIVQLLKQVLQSCIIPVVESRRTGSSSQIFNMAMQYKNDIHPLLRRCGNVLNQLVALIGSITLTDFTLSAIESLATTVFFTQNGEKETESALGIQRFESFRQKAMDILAQIFARHPNQRESLTIEILNNLEKLPDKRATARQFKSPRAEPIMLISALFMRMVQAATTSIPTNSMEAMQDVKGEAESQSDTDQSMKRKTAERGANKHLSQFTKDLCAASRTVATHIARMFVQRAENVSKSGDKPFRNLLDLFIEDLCKTLGSPEWPAASVLLAKLLALMVQITQNMKVKGAQAVEMAIFTMGSMGCGIIDFTSRLRKIRHALDISKSDVSSKLVPLAEEALSHNVNIKDILALDGPYRWVVESLPRYLDPQDPQVQVLSEYYVTYWTDSFYRDIEAEDADGIRSESINNLEKHLAKMAMDPQWLSKE
jgi:cohesin loading factor subunit SCC2